MELSTSRLILREFQDSDFQALSDLENDPEMQRFEREAIPTAEATRAYLQQAQQDAAERPRSHYYLAVTVKPQQGLIGRVVLKLNFKTIREWEIGWAIRRDEWGRGYAAEAARELLRLAFGELNAHRVVAFCHAQNRQSVRVMEKIGMRPDGLLRQTRWLNKQWHDEWIYSILEREWKA